MDDGCAMSDERPSLLIGGSLSLPLILFVETDIRLQPTSTIVMITNHPLSTLEKILLLPSMMLAILMDCALWSLFRTVLLVLSFLGLCTLATPVDITTPLGVVRGKLETVAGHPVASFLGVPFGQPPVGKLRFQPPQMVKPWSTIKLATTPAKACYQGKDTTFPGFRGAEMWNANTPIDEDCLYLNMWVPWGVRNATVLVWLYGGGFWYGSPSLELYDGRAFASEGNVIIVNLNYRMGVFGFLYLDDPRVPGNMGLLDQQLGLRWIRENIAYFGGNPDSVCLIGESAGAASIVAHMISAQSQPLFKNGILQSGALDNPWAMEVPKKAYGKAMDFVRSLKCDFSEKALIIDCLLNKTAKQLNDALWDVTLSFLEFPFVIVSQDRAGFFTEDAFVSLHEGQYKKDMDLIIGINEDEGSFWTFYYLPRYFRIDQENLLNQEAFLECLEEALSLYSPVMRRAAAFHYWDRQCRNQPFHYRDAVNKMQRSSSNPWPAWAGVMHGYEIEFVFGLPLLHPANYTAQEAEFSKEIIRYWTTFASTGKPEVPQRSLQWPQYTLESKQSFALKFRNRGIEYHLKEDTCKTWRAAREIEYLLYKNELNAGQKNCHSQILCIMMAFISFLCSILKI
ncbi:Acetylcholinesterase [Trichinella pseudospiralis]